MIKIYQSRVLDNEMFRKYMELVPGKVLTLERRYSRVVSGLGLVRMVETYYTCQFGECFQLLGAMEVRLVHFAVIADGTQNDILLDYYAAAHYHRLNKMMREKAIQMYFRYELATHSQRS